MTEQNPGRGKLMVATALALSIGWGIRGNYGHETGAMIPGALAAMAAVILSGRGDWQARIGYFAFFGALGWSFGGSISYMQVIGYTHSGDSLSVLYGFVCLFVIGFLWGAPGGAGTALPACLDPIELEEFFPPVVTVFVAWVLQDVVVGILDHTDPAFRQRDPLYWYDTDWLGVSVALVAVLLLAMIRRKYNSATSFIVHMAVGWWVGFLVLVVFLGWRMTPPRGDNWAGCLGMVAGMLIYFERRKWRLVTASSVIAGTLGGVGFAGADLIKLIGIRTGWETNWHSVLEQTYGLINGIGIGAVVLWLARRAPERGGGPARKCWHWFATGFVLLGVTYLNLRKNAGVWVGAKAVPGELYGISGPGWFNIGFAIVGMMFAALMLAQARKCLPVMPESGLGKAQLFFVIFLWWIVIGNFERALVAFAPQRLITEGVIFLNAAICTVLVLLPGSSFEAKSFAPEGAGSIGRTVAWAAAVLVMTPLLCWAGIRALYGDEKAGYANLHIRFGPNATATKAKPVPDKPHP